MSKYAPTYVRRSKAWASSQVGGQVYLNDKTKQRNRHRPAETSTKPAQNSETGRDQQRPAQNKHKKAKPAESSRDHHKTSTKQQTKNSFLAAAGPKDLSPRNPKHIECLLLCAATSLRASMWCQSRAAILERRTPGHSPHFSWSSELSDQFRHPFFPVRRLTPGFSFSSLPKGSRRGCRPLFPGGRRIFPG